MNVYKSVLSSSNEGNSEDIIDDFSITSLPVNRQYEAGSNLDTTGLEATAVIGSLSGNVIEDCSISPTKFENEGVHTVTVNYHGHTDTFNVLISSETPGSLEETSWSLIKQIGASGLGEQYWAIGDTKTITLNGSTRTLTLNNYQTKVFIIEFNYRGVNGIYFQGFKDVSSEKYYMIYKSDAQAVAGGFHIDHWKANNSFGGYGGWRGCDARYDLLGSTDVQPSGYGAKLTADRQGYDATSTCATNPVEYTLMSCFPSDLRAVMAPWVVWADGYCRNGDNSTANVGKSYREHVVSSVDYLPLLAEFEIFGARSRANAYEQEFQAQMTFYKNGGSKVRYQHNSSSTKQYWWTRSFATTAQENYPQFVCVGSGGGVASYSVGKIGNVGLCPAFRVA